MNCDEFIKLTPIEKSNYIGSIAHCCMNDSKLFEIGMKMIKRGVKMGLFENVEINPIHSMKGEGNEIDNLEWVTNSENKNLHDKTKTT